MTIPRVRGAYCNTSVIAGQTRGYKSNRVPHRGRLLRFSRNRDRVGRPVYRLKLSADKSLPRLQTWQTWDACLTFLSGHSKKSSRFLFDMLTAALGAFGICFMFLEGENQFEGFVTVEANIIVHGHGILPLDRDHELRIELYAARERLSVTC